MNILDEFLQKRQLTLDKLIGEEREQYFKWLNQLDETNKSLTIDDVKGHISFMKEAIERELSTHDNAPTTWLSLLSLLIPLVGIVRRWYIDQKINRLTARLENYVLLEAFLESKDRAKTMLEKQIRQYMDLQEVRK